MTSDDLTSLTAAEYRAERAENLFRQYVEQIRLAYRSDDPWDWMKAGSLFKRFKTVAHNAELSQDDVDTHYAGLPIEGGVQ